MVLHHELLLALAGHVGGEVFVERDGTFVLADGLPLLDCSERVAVGDLLPLGALYRDLDAFVERHLCGALAAGASGLYVRALCRGIDAELDAYRHALVVIEDACKAASADGLAAIAARARAPASAAEAEVSAGLSMVRMQHELSDYRATIPALHRLAATVDDECLRGARVLELVHAQASAHARTPTGACLRRVLRHCNATLLHQARGWMLHGVRFDPHVEFFVQHAAAISGAIRDRAASSSASARGERGGASAGAARSARTPLAISEPHGSTLGTPRTPDEPDDAARGDVRRPAARARADGGARDDDGEGADDGGAAELLAEVSDLTEQVAADWRELAVCLYDKPSYVPLRLAERILFVGKAARVLEHQTFLALARPTAAAAARGAGAARRARAPVGGVDGAGADAHGHDDDLADEARALEAFDERLEALQWAEELPLFELAAAVDALSALSARRLWRFVVVESELPTHFRALRAIALTARGDILHAVVASGAHVMAARRPPTDRQLTALLHAAVGAARAQLPTLAPLERALEQIPPPMVGGTAAALAARTPPGASDGCARAVLDLISERFELRLADVERPMAESSRALPCAPGEPFSASSTALGRWRAVRLWWRTEWPLNLVFGGDALQRYNDVFSFLLAVRVTQAQLQGAWLTTPTSLRGGRERRRARVAEARMRPLRALRARMAFFVDAIQFYLHADVLEPSWRQLDGRVRASSDFEEVLRCHDAFLSSLGAQTFRHVPAARGALDLVMTQCIALCSLLEAAEDRAAASSLGHADDVPYDAAELAHVERAFGESSSFLLEFLRAAHGASPGASPHLAQLLMRIDFNGFWSAVALHPSQGWCATNEPGAS